MKKDLRLFLSQIVSKPHQVVAMTAVNLDKNMEFGPL